MSAATTVPREGCSAEEIAAAYRLPETTRIRALELVFPVESAPDIGTPIAPEESVTA